MGMPYRDMSRYPYGRGTCHVYLLHFATPIGHARHYVGQTARLDVVERILEHRAGKGARLTKVAASRGIELFVAHVWLDAPRCYEQRLKNRGGLRRVCPICKELEAMEKRNAVA